MFGLFKKKLTVVTHNGSFHADEVFACAALSIWADKNNFKLNIVRTREENKIYAADIVVDIGGVYDQNTDRFDHHQEGGAGVRNNNIPYASFGLVWLKYGLMISGQSKISENIDKILVQPIDANDNGFEYIKSDIGIHPYTVGNILHSYLPTWLEEFSNDKGFSNALQFAKHILKREIKIQKDTLEAEILVHAVYASTEDKRILIFNKRHPWEEVVSGLKDVLFVVYPKSDQDWAVKTTRDNIKEYNSRKLLPQIWAGKRDSNLQEITGVSDAIFCHRGLFIAVAKTKEGAIKLARLALQDSQK